MNSGIGVSSATQVEKTGSLMACKRCSGTATPRTPNGFARHAAQAAALGGPIVAHQARRSEVNAPGDSAASPSAKARRMGPSRKSPCEFTQKTWTTGSSQVRRG